MENWIGIQRIKLVEKTHFLNIVQKTAQSVFTRITIDYIKKLPSKMSHTSYLARNLAKNRKL
jgi:hypothetical protein